MTSRVAGRLMAEKSEIDSLKTKEQRFKAIKWDKFFVPRSIVFSKAWLSLRTATACQVYMIFRHKCRMEKVQTRPMSREKEWRITNNGEIQFTYKEAWEKWGISSSKFTRAIDELIRVGLIDITKSGFGLRKDESRYAISERWENLGTDEFVARKREKRKQNLGFTKGNRYGQNCAKK